MCVTVSVAVWPAQCGSVCGRVPRVESRGVRTRDVLSHNPCEDPTEHHAYVRRMRLCVRWSALQCLCCWLAPLSQPPMRLVLSFSAALLLGRQVRAYG